MIRLLAALAVLICVAPALAQPLAAGADPQNTILIDTKYGRIVIKLRNDIAPKHVERIKLLAREKYYDNVPFHRVIAGFMAQTGDGTRGDGTGGSKYPNLPAEFSNVPFKRGTVGMARANDPNSANSQFFIMYADGAFLNGKYTVVGEVVSGGEDAALAQYFTRLEAAIAIQAATPEQLLEGVHATLRQLSAALDRNKVIEINPSAGTKFDPHQHQAISVVPADQEPNTVVAVLQKGYLIADRVLRPALVTVTAAK